MLSSIVDLLGVLVECLIFLIQLEIVITDLIFYIFHCFIVNKEHKVEFTLKDFKRF